MKQSFRTKLRQLWVPKVFRLPEPEFTKDQIDLLEELIQLIHPTLSMAESATRDDRVHMAHFLVDLGTGIWRIRRKIESLGRMPKEIRDALYSLESTWMSMSEGGVEIVDHIGTIPSKNEAKIVEVRDIPNLAREQVVDAIKPTILLKGEVIQLGEVVMGRPAKSEELPAATPEPEDGVRSAFEPQVEAYAEAEEETVSHEVETMSMELPVVPDEPAEEMSGLTDGEIETLAEEAEGPEPAAPHEEPTPEEAAEIASELPVVDEDDEIVSMPGAASIVEQIEEAAGEPFVSDEPEAEPLEAIEAETPVVNMEMPRMDEIKEPTVDVVDTPADVADAALDEPVAADTIEEGFVRDVPTPFEQAIAQEEQEETEKPKKKRAAAKKPTPEKKEKKSEDASDESPETPKPKKRRSTKKSAAVAEVDNDG